jgi:hypothetical protein
MVLQEKIRSGMEVAQHCRSDVPAQAPSLWVLIQGVGVLLEGVLLEHRDWIPYFAPSGCISFVLRTFGCHKWTDGPHSQPSLLTQI